MSALPGALGALCYVLSLGLAWRWVQADRDQRRPYPARRPTAAAGCLLLAALLHAATLGADCCRSGGIDLSLGHLVSVICWMTVCLLLLASISRPTFSLAVIVIPIGLLGLLIGVGFAGRPMRFDSLPQYLQYHILVAIPAYGILCIACAQAMVILFQDRRLKTPGKGGFLPALPALQTMDANLFLLLRLGFVLLTLNLFFGAYASYAQSGRVLQWNHHILLIVLAWGGFAGVLLGRKVYGWRGKPAAIGTISAFALLALAYYGTRFVTEVVLG